MTRIFKLPSERISWKQWVARVKPSCLIPLSYQKVSTSPSSLLLLKQHMLLPKSHKKCLRDHRSQAIFSAVWLMWKTSSNPTKYIQWTLSKTGQDQGHEGNRMYDQNRFSVSRAHNIGLCGIAIYRKLRRYGSGESFQRIPNIPRAEHLMINIGGFIID